MESIVCFKSKFGWINAKESNGCILSVAFGKIKQKKPSKILIALKNNICRYFLGEEIIKEFPLIVIGTPLQKKIWNELLKIPYAKTNTYGKIAQKLKTSPRYVGNVCGQNNHLLLIPCHRVVRSDGSLGGFSGLGGMKLKSKLIKMEFNA